MPCIHCIVYTALFIKRQGFSQEGPTNTSVYGTAALAQWRMRLYGVGGNKPSCEMNCPSEVGQGKSRDLMIGKKKGLILSIWSEFNHFTAQPNSTAFDQSKGTPREIDRKEDLKALDRSRKGYVREIRRTKPMKIRRAKLWKIRHTKPRGIRCAKTRDRLKERQGN